MPWPSQAPPSSSRSARRAECRRSDLTIRLPPSCGRRRKASRLLVGADGPNRTGRTSAAAGDSRWAGRDQPRVFSLPLARASGSPGKVESRPRVVVRLAQGEGPSRAGREEPAPTVPSKRESRFVGSATSALWALRRRGSERSVQLERDVAAGHAGRGRWRNGSIAWPGRVVSAAGTESLRRVA